MGWFITNISLKSVFDGFSALKRNVSEWVITLDTKQYELEKRIQTLEARQRDVEVYLRYQKWNFR